MKTKFIQLFCLILTLIWIIPCKGQVVTKEEATKIAQNWIHIVIDNYGTWGNAENASILLVRTLEKDGRKLGYFCNVTPKGFILVSIRKELAPVKLYSDEGSYPSDEVDCLPDLIYDIPAKVINAIEAELAPIESVSSSELKEILEIDYSEAWHQVYNYMPGTYKKKTTGSSGMDSYQEGEWLLRSKWGQSPPYNEACVTMPPPCGTSNSRALVGCVATAGAQIMNYWDWPPYGVAPYDDPYNWPQMPDSIDYSYSSPEKIAAVAEICAELGGALETAYGCEVSIAYIYCPWGVPYICGQNSDLESVLVSTFHFSPGITAEIRILHSADAWFDMIKDQINKSRPISYALMVDILNHHVVVVDGWQEVGLKQYHINFGWAGNESGQPCWTHTGNSNAWYTLDGIDCFEDEFMLLNTMPDNAVGSFVFGSYPKQPAFPYRYFDMHTEGHDAVFSEGQYLQFFPGITVTSNSSSAHPVRFYGTTSDDLQLFTRGDPSNGIRLHNGEIELTNFGSIKLH
nr:C10 family peptidase [Bacteroidota bacterium]